MPKSLLLAAAALFPIIATPARATDPATRKAAIDAIIDHNWADLDALYIDLHSHPELGFQENRTSALLAARMRKLGFTVTEHVGRTGVVAVWEKRGWSGSPGTDRDRRAAASVR